MPDEHVNPREVTSTRARRPTDRGFPLSHAMRQQTFADRVSRSVLEGESSACVWIRLSGFSLLSSLATGAWDE